MGHARTYNPDAAEAANKTDARAPQKAQKMTWWQTPRARMVGLIVLAAAIAGAVAWWFLIHPYVSTDDARVATTLVRVAPEGVGGRVLKLNVQEGDHVKKGDVLLELDHRLTEAQLQKSRARADLAEHELRRVSALVAQRGLPPRELDNARANAEAAAADLKLAEIANDNTTIKSEIDGIIVQKSTEAGNIVEPGQTLLTVSDEEHAWIAANIEETSIGQIQPGQRVYIVIDEGGSLWGRVSEIRASVAAQFALIPSDNGAGNFTKVVQRVPIKIKIDEASRQKLARVLRPGQSVEIKIRVH